MINVIYTNAPLEKNWTGWLPGYLVDNNTMTIENPEATGDKYVTFSMQPEGIYGHRKLGTAGQYEVFSKSGNNLIFSPRPGEFYVVAFLEIL